MTDVQRNQVAAMNSSGMTIDEIVLDTGLNKEEVELFIAERNNKRKAISETTKKAVIEWYQSGHSEKQCAKKFGISPASAHRIIAGAKEKGSAAAEAKTEPEKKQPAAAEAKTEPKKKAVIPTAEKQALKSAKDKMLAIYETLTPEETRAWEMGEVYAEIVRGLE
jgi:hypothetical protein